ncbi:OmpH family outer membrane protein [Syntrophobacter fumaroxidans]|uniref:Outer membrane chaperone Skp (OmpH) n=1 Tax=Syntrophobacter fumaroxidans (strain DSM 10017 / MPOB) TaxID=335543 RepID=A0LPR4_SYNFM|nr:OmpH family outer membrane protein [Syntrophobacter fumaroxidans]ABK19416.1 outer membrane chaperone Skp (OmpH) [Syntrophobacter fumaroxidans MPOB]
MKMKKSMWILLFLGIFLASSMPVLAAGNPKIGYFDIPLVLQQSQWGKRSNEEFKRQGEKIKAEVDTKAQSYKTAKEEFDRKKDVFDEKTRAKKLKELQDMQMEGEKLLSESNAKMNKLSNELSAPLIDKILEIVKKIGREDKFDYIFERERAGLVFANDKEDLTKRIIQELDRSPQK